ncbi:hypothetical protein JXA32_03730, partial [Candidatus Sumerlaeota bacterium]|nr:hypothetical protein [Candidatus Sumerlaeota bacterium]
LGLTTNIALEGRITRLEQEKALFQRAASEFWQHWHITLSRWLRDYLYIPLGGNRYGTARTLRNLTITMLLGGLWHGAAWHFVVWGAYHGMLLVAFRLAKVEEALRKYPRWRWAAVFVMFQLTCVGWMIFRAPDMAALKSISESLLFNFFAPTVKSRYLLGSTIFYASIPTLILAMQFRRGAHREMPLDNDYHKITLVIGMIYLLLMFGNWGTRSFIYFQF